ACRARRPLRTIRGSSSSATARRPARSAATGPAGRLRPRSTGGCAPSDPCGVRPDAAPARAQRYRGERPPLPDPRMTTMPRMAPHKVVLHGHELSYLDSGSGPVVLFIHGILGSQRQWAHLVDEMDDDHRVLVPDLFGHGESAKPLGDYSLSAHAAALRDLLDHLDIERVTLVGHSLGGGIAMQFFYLFPERVDRLVLVGSGGLGREVNLLLRSATLPLAEQVLSV